VGKRVKAGKDKKINFFVAACKTVCHMPEQTGCRLRQNIAYRQFRLLQTAALR